MNLRTKLLILLIMFSLVPLGFVGRTLIRITRDELKSSVNSELLNVANQSVQELEDFYLYSWLAPLRLIRQTVENEDLGVAEKVALMKEGIKSVADIVSIQISVENVSSPLLIIEDDFASRLSASGIDSKSAILVSDEQIEELRLPNKETIGDLTHLKDADVWLLTLVVPLSDNTFGRPATMVARLNLDNLKSRLENHSFTASGTITLIDADGKVIFDKDRRNISEYSIVKVAKDLLLKNSRTVNVEPYTRPDGTDMLAAYSFPTYMDWAIIVEKDAKSAYSIVSFMFRNLMVWLGVGFVVAIIGGAVFSVSLTGPLTKLTKAATTLAAGDLTTKVEGVERKDEIGTLSLTFNKMVGDLTRYIDELTIATAARERADAELKLAWNIQSSFLPREFPDTAQFAIWGTCTPARDVGGDYFDVFQLDDDNWGIVIGDVSGKGIPAALFMAVSRTLFRMLALPGISPDKVMMEFNDRLTAFNPDSAMFITIFYGIYNCKTGEFQYSSAGHNMPFIRLESQNNGKLTMLPNMESIVAGMFDNMPMKIDTVTMQKGDYIVLYTDGMNEAINNDEVEYGEERLQDKIEELSDLTPDEMCMALIKEVKDYQADQPQFDDMTLVILKVKG